MLVNEEVDILLVEHINGDWIIKDPSLNYQKKDASTIHFAFLVQAGETKAFTIPIVKNGNSFVKGRVFGVNFSRFSCYKWLRPSSG